MNAIWTIENICGREVKLTEAEIATLRVSVSLWKKNNPKDTRILYCDNAYREYFKSLGLLDYFDVIDSRLLENKKKSINKEVFWASAKLEAMKATKAPLVHIDNDFFAVKNLSKLGLFDCNVAVSMEEDTSGFYMSPVIATEFHKIKLIPEFKGIAYNTSLVYFKNENVKNEYCNIALRYMRDMSNIYDRDIFNANHSFYMIFAEQQILGEFCHVKRMKVKKLINQVFSPRAGNFLTDVKEDGLFKAEEISGIAGHLGDIKQKFREDAAYSKAFAKNVTKYLKY